MAFDTCASAGCHNFHDNEALYEDFLVKHANEAPTLSKPQVAQRDLGEFFDAVNETPAIALAAGQNNGPESGGNSHIIGDWANSAHANGGVNCDGCHQYDADGGTAPWRDDPSDKICNRCHKTEARDFTSGKHGMRLAENLPPMSPKLARLPMKEKVADKTLSCHTCHKSHQYDTRAAAVDACLGCHDDQHSRAYKQSKHYRLWIAEIEKQQAPGSGVSCATCHMPRIDHRERYIQRTLVQHNQNWNFQPNEKMIRSVCMNCHGLGFSIDVLADTKLIRNNFVGQPDEHVSSIEMAVKRQKQKAKEKLAAESGVRDSFPTTQ
jgi:formate-dependent nitrite reductase cytochrome c552 subunit